MSLVDDSFRQGVCQLDGPEVGQLDAALAVVVDLADGASGAEGSGADELLLLEGWLSGFDLWVAPVLYCGAEVVDGAVDDAVRDFLQEGGIVVLGFVDSLVEVLLGGPGEAVGATEAVGGDAEVVHEARYADGAARVSGLPYREPDGHDVSGGDVARRAR